MAKTSIQIRLPEELEAEISHHTKKSKSSFVREAIEEKLRREKDKKLEEQWIKALQKHPEEEGEIWSTEAWGEK